MKGTTAALSPKDHHPVGEQKNNVYLESSKIILKRKSYFNQLENCRTREPKLV